MRLHVEFDDGTTICISEDAIVRVSRYITENGFMFESGGILLGRQTEGRMEFEIVEMSVPSKHDQKGHFSFLRMMGPANRLISSAWRKTHGVVNYLGEWHTHNEAIPVPSATDSELMHQVVKDGCCLLDRAFMMIIGNTRQAFLGAVNPNNNGGFYSERYIKWTE